MRQIKPKSPISILICIGDKGSADEIEEYLNSKNLNTSLTFIGKGTSESEVSDIFGFGMSDKDIVAAIIPLEKKDSILRAINRITGVEKDKFGLNMVLPINSTSSVLLELMGVKL